MMRLSTAQQRVLKNTIRRLFGENTRVLVFGSRVDDSRRGGDFDVFVDTDIASADEIVTRKLECLMALHDTPEFEGEKIDLVIRSPLHREELPIHTVALRDGVTL
ncbi:MAG: nucleotidyltransferase domain-containing protein [Gammaproteobacteria bacterium]|jgi:predicted nucleotidyltransferase|nr:nucleotidyltransferase domain-containing protein [Gammaproteobacteria bacterium]